MNHCAFVATVAFSGTFAMHATFAPGRSKTRLSAARSTSTAQPLPQIPATGFGNALAPGLTAMPPQPSSAGASA